MAFLTYANYDLLNELMNDFGHHNDCACHVSSYNTNHKYAFMSAIADVNVYNDKDGSPRAMRIDFYDGTNTKAVLQDGDTFNFEQAALICLMKKLLDEQTNGNGHQVCNKLVRKVRKIYDGKQKEKAAMEKLEQEEAERKARLAAKKKRRDERRMNEARDVLVDLLRDALGKAGE